MAFRAAATESRDCLGDSVLLSPFRVRQQQRADVPEATTSTATKQRTRFCLLARRNEACRRLCIYRLSGALILCVVASFVSARGIWGHVILVRFCRGPSLSAVLCALAEVGFLILRLRRERENIASLVLWVLALLGVVLVSLRLAQGSSQPSSGGCRVGQPAR